MYRYSYGVNRYKVYVGQVDIVHLVVCSCFPQVVNKYKEFREKYWDYIKIHSCRTINIDFEHANHSSDSYSNLGSTVNFLDA